MRSPICSGVSVLVTAVLLSAQTAFAFESPLSDESVREAYFLGQRHDDSLERLLEKYTHPLPPPETGPYISSIMFLTPFMRAARRGTRIRRHSGGDRSVVAVSWIYNDLNNFSPFLLMIERRLLRAVVSGAAARKPRGPHKRSKKHDRRDVRPGFWRRQRVRVFFQQAFEGIIMTLAQEVSFADGFVR